MVVSRAEILSFSWHHQDNKLAVHTSNPDVLKCTGESSEIIQ